MLSVVCLYLPIAQAAGSQEVNPGARYQLQRQLFIAGRESLAAGNVEAASERIADLDGYPLQSHYEYLVLRQRIQQSEAPLSLLPSLNSFAGAYRDQRSHRRLLGVMKNRLVALEDWSAYQQVARITAAPRHPCDDLYASVLTGDLNKFDKGASELWHNVGSHTAHCDEAFKLLIERSGKVPTGALWKRTVALLKRGSPDAIAELLPYFGSRDRRIVQSWADNLDNPEALLRLESVNGNMIHHQHLVSYVLGRWLAADLPAATAFWKANGAAFGFDQQELAQVTARHAVLAAKRSLGEASALLQQASSADRQVRYWRIRSALKQQQWANVLQHLDALTPKEQATARWQYWRARAFEELGRGTDATKIYRGLADRFEYYGFLSADRSAHDYNLPDTASKVDETTFTTVADDEAIARAIEFFLVGISWEGRREWNKALQGASDRKLLAAARLAYSIGWYDRSFASVKKSGITSVLEYQFPMPKPELVSSLAQQKTLDASLIYAVMRRESGYIPDVKSPAGAIGLMQLMPATAKEMAAKASLGKSTWNLIDAEVNIRLGVEYLSAMLNRYDGSVAYAAAAYNAGPGRVNRWREGSRLPVDIWVETLPFDETRDYVKGVLFNAAVFDSLLEPNQTRVLSMMESD